MSDTHLFLLQWGKVLLRWRGPDTMVIIAGGVFYVTPDMDEKSGIRILHINKQERRERSNASLVYG